MVEYGIAIAVSQRAKMREARKTRTSLSRRSRRMTRTVFICVSHGWSSKICESTSNGRIETRSMMNHPQKYRDRILRRSFTRRLPRLGSG